MKKRMSLFNHWRRGNRIKIFVPRTVVEVKMGKSGKNRQSQRTPTPCAGGCGGACGLGEND